MKSSLCVYVKFSNAFLIEGNKLNTYYTFSNSKAPFDNIDCVIFVIDIFAVMLPVKASWSLFSLRTIYHTMELSATVTESAIVLIGQGHGEW